MRSIWCVVRIKVGSFLNSIILLFTLFHSTRRGEFVDRTACFNGHCTRSDHTSLLKSVFFLDSGNRAVYDCFNGLRWNNGKRINIQFKKVQKQSKIFYIFMLEDWNDCWHTHIRIINLSLQQLAVFVLLFWSHSRHLVLFLCKSFEIEPIAVFL